jgi:hypothetical protein
MSLLPRLRLLVTPLLFTAACATEPSPVTPPGENFVRVDNHVRGMHESSMLAAFTDRDGTVWIGGNIGVLLRREPGGEWVVEPILVTGIVSGLWQDADGHMLATAGTELLQRGLELADWDPVPIPSSSLLLDVWGLDGERIFVGGTAGTILRRVDGEWLRAEVPTGNEIWGFGGTSESDLVAVGQNGTILESSDAGANWVKATSPTTSTLFAVAADGAGRVVAVGSGGTVLLRDGDTWESTASPTELNLFEVRSSGPGQFMITGDGGEIFEGNGLTWQRVPTVGIRENFRAITGAPGSRVVAGWFATVVDEADGWAASHTGTRIYGVHAPVGGDPIAVGQGGAGYQRRNGIWQSLFIPSPGSLFAIAGPTPNDRLAVGDSGGVMHFNGATWQREVVPATGLLRSVWYDGTHALVVGNNGTALVRENGSWRTVNTGTTRFLRHVGGRDWGTLYVAGDSGTLLRWDGSQFDAIDVPVTQNLRSSWVRTTRDVYVVGDIGTVLHFDGWSWTRQPTPTLNDLRTIHAVDNVLYAAGDFGQIWRFDGDGWTALPVDQLGFWLHLAGDDELIAVGEVGTIAEGVK